MAVLTIAPETPVVGEPFTVTYQPLLPPRKGKFRRAVYAEWNHVYGFGAGTRGGRLHADAWQPRPYTDLSGIYTLTLEPTEFAVPGETLDCEFAIGVADGKGGFISYDKLRFHATVRGSI